MNQPETVDVLIVGSGPAGATYARTIGDAAPKARVLMVEVGPVVPGSRGDHTQNLTDEERAAAQLLTQGPDAGVVRAQALSDIAPGIDPSLEFRQTILPGLFFVGASVAPSHGPVMRFVYGSDHAVRRVSARLSSFAPKSRVSAGAAG